jgi:MscS family membrane protein
MRFLFLLFLALGLTPPAQAAADCTTPQSAVKSLFLGLGADSPQDSDFCFDLAAEDASESERLAGQLLQVLDARGLFIQMKAFPEEPNPVDEAGERIEHYALHADLPVIFVEKTESGWHYAQSATTAVGSLYSETFSGLSLWFQNLLPQIFSQPVLLNVRPWQALWLGILLFGGLFLGFLAHSVVGARIRQAIQNRGHKMDAELYARVRLPTLLLSTGGVLLWGVSDLQLTIKPSLFLHYAAKGMVSLAVVMLTMRLIDVFGRILEEKADATEGRMDDQLVPVAIRIAKLFAGLVGLIFVMQNIGVDVSALIASLGVGGIAIALAAKDTLANVFGSVTIFTDRPFQVGDTVKIDGVVGTVEEVGLRSTRIRTASNSLLSIPNATVANSNIDNLGARNYRRTKVTLGLTYGTSTEQITDFVEGVRGILESTETVKKDNYEVHFIEFGPSSLDIITSYYLSVDGWHDEMIVKSEINMNIIRLAEKLGVDFAFPSQSIYVESLPKRS